MEIGKLARSNHCMVRNVINVFLTSFLIIDGYDATKIKRVVEVQARPSRSVSEILKQH